MSTPPDIKHKQMNRNQEIIRVSLVGIASNVLLATFKAVVGFMSSSIAIVMDAVNNLSDALSSVITIAGTKLSERPANRKHPFGYGRVEYFTGIVIALIVLLAGFTSLIESVKKIFHPTMPLYSTLTLMVIVVAVFVKLALGRYVKRQGRRLNSNALIASGADATFDAAVTLSTLVSAGLMLLWGFNLDGLLGTLISLLIIKAGIEMLSAPVGDLLGRSISPQYVERIRNEVMAFPEVMGVYDIILNNYGPETIIGSLHVNVMDTLTAREIHGLTRKITLTLYQKHNIIITVGIYAINTTGVMADLQRQVMLLAYNHEHVLQVHAFYVYEDRHLITLDIVPDDSIRDDEAFLAHLREHFREALPQYEFQLIIDHNYVRKES